MNGQKKPRGRRIGFELLPQAKDMIVHRSGRRVILVSPYLVQELLTRNDPAGRGGQVLQKFELLRRQSNGFTGANRLHAGEIDSRIAEEQDFAAYGSRGHMRNNWFGRPGAPHGTTYTSQKLFRAERLGYVIVGTQFQQENLVIDFRDCAQNHHGYGGGDALEFAAQFLARDAG